MTDSNVIPLEKRRVRIRAGMSPRDDLQRKTVYATYEAAKNTNLRNYYFNRGTQNQLVQRSAAALRTQARHLARNHDLARGVLRTLVNNIVGPGGIGVEPQPRRADGSIHEEYAKDLRELYRDWCKKPEVTHRLSWAKCQRAAVRALFRDGEIFAQQVIGPRADLRHGTVVPYSLELFEAEMVPLDLHDEGKRILQGIELNAWGQPVALHVTKTTPWRVSPPYSAETKVIPWERVLHLANLDHVGQLRGVTEFASVITRIEDIKDYEESERVAAKLAAMMGGYIKKGAPEDYEKAADPREMSFEPGMIFDDLMPGEEIGMLETNRPNPNLITFRGGQLKAVAAGTGTSDSSISKNYDGTYSAQRQELVEQWVHYAVATDDVVTAFIQPNWQRFVETAHLSGVLRMPQGLKPGTHDDALFIGQSMPWIDPLKEAAGWQLLVQSGFASEVEVMRKRGVNPYDVLEQVKTWRQKCEESEIAFETNPLGLEKLMAVNGADQ